jgi:hypothetical protein
MKEMAAVSLAFSEIATTTEPWSGIKALMLAVLEDAVQSLSSRNSLARAEAEFWMTSREHRYVFSFVVICEALGLEPSAVRRSVIGLLNSKPTGRRLLRRARPNVRHGGALRVSTRNGGTQRKA